MPQYWNTILSLGLWVASCSEWEPPIREALAGRTNIRSVSEKNCYLLGNALGSWNAPATHKHVTTSFLRIDFWTSGLYVIYVLGMSNIYCISHCPDGLTPDHWVLLPSRQPPTSPFRTVWETMGEALLYIRDDIIPAHKMMNYIKWHPFL